METSEVDTSILSSLHGNRYDYLRADDKESFGDSAFLAENLDKELPKTLPELSEITDSDTYLRDNEPSQMMTIDSSWNEDSTSCFPTSTNSSFPIPLPGPSDFDEFNSIQTVPRAETPGLGLSTIFAADGDLSDPTAEIGVCGLRNLGNTCFMSAGLQALLSTESLVSYFLSFDDDGSEDTLIGQFSDLAKRVWNGQYSVINPHQFKYVLGKRYAQFRDCSQHDCQEFLALLLDSLNDELLMHFAKHCKVTSRKTQKLSENQDFMAQKANNTDADVFVSPNIDDGTISSCEPELLKAKVQINDLLNGKREICCDSSSDSRLMDLKRVKLDDNKIPKTELVEADSIGSTILEKHIQQDSIINKIFQGQFESSVTCLECNYVSVMHEPFMYLSVPLPYATQQQIYITFVSATHNPPMKYLITVNKQDDIKKVKSELVNLIGEDKHPDMLVVAEVFNRHISKILSDDHQVRSVDSNNRDLYAFEVLEINLDLVNGDIEELTEGDTQIEPMDIDSVTIEQGDVCTICLEYKHNMVLHKDIKDCTCVLCEECVKSSCFHSSGDKDRMDCPVCRVRIDPKVDLIPIEQPAGSTNKAIRRLTIPIVFKQADGKSLIGRPALVRLPSEVPAEVLYIEVAKLHPYTQDFTLSLVDGQGTMCSRCLWDVHCGGCIITNKNGIIKFRSGDTLAVTFIDYVDVYLLDTKLHPGSTEQMRSNKPLSIYDCINAFCQSELLDDNNPWWCPSCKKNQRATKTLSISKYPRCLIVYLKRFVFHENWGIKLQDSVVFPLDGLILDIKQEIVYDLYACVCHTGSTSMGHYTSYTRHVHSEDWHYYNDETAIKTIPGQEDYCNAYILFYKKQGLPDDDADSSGL
ncbi:ubiquitin carboxyl-terminal hydrolase 4 isoform X2 [Acyrthosiphon pisum]|uniref:ubiquitinyl hydrolase 1 n=1 Tax=Acyrthosiphon pisum TaxID=7029 RepID=A0A8R2B6X9_ACYPI|nr:ubiquitin carboxyl-terminal hydrolase 4 isoform X2 [Acyrthosiphon pisum]|eukprot:XP_008184822.1 PREDICTED: ubiquitin carboxyl-terminal hydrolase 4 isoform X2 [Acyrthosiphon pisum]